MRNEPFGPLEDLDPEPPATARQARRWELLIGDANLHGHGYPRRPGRLIGPAPPTLRLGQGLLAYIAPGGILHARAYDGTIDLALEPGVTALYRQAVYDLPYDVP